MSKVCCPLCQSTQFDRYRMHGQSYRECQLCGDLKAIKRKPREYSKPSKAQLERMEKIKSYFLKRTGEAIKVAELVPLGGDYRSAWFRIETEGSLWVKDGGYEVIGRKGKAIFRGTYGLHESETKQIKHFNAMVN